MQHDVITPIILPRGTKLLQLHRSVEGWKVWIASIDMIHGTYILLRDDGSVIRVTERAGEGPEEFRIR